MTIFRIHALGEVSFVTSRGASLFVGGQNFLGYSKGGGAKFFRGAKGGTRFFSGVQEGGPELFFLLFSNSGASKVYFWPIQGVRRPFWATTADSEAHFGPIQGIRRPIWGPFK